MTNSDSDIYKSAGIIIQDRKLLVEKDIDKEFFISPGGKIEIGETPEQALIRELQEEFTILVKPEDLEKFDTFSAPAAGQEHRTVYMHVYFVHNFTGQISRGHQVEKLLWLSSSIPSDVKIGSIFEHQVIPGLKQLDLID